MLGIKTVGEKKFCGNCEVEVNNNQKYCHECGNPLTLAAIAEYSENVKNQMETFVLKVSEYAKEHNTGLKEAIKEILELY